ncbi:FxsA family protein [Telmatospirillum sp.]|uniref:FxsA family protein n=1 Tax=Telmatospirillum sp. TaxID=2079197 RepID=UPI00284FABA1|nr:FxsA family protein [Telmatospirillum sp.]MDR3439613.1 FxsA family protein [Telmatospirillum sp.]
MAWILPLLFLAWPVIEIAAVITVAGWLGWPGAIAGIVLSGALGLALLQRQGLATARVAQDQMRQGEMPVGALFDGTCLALAGLLLLLPGFVTDLLALPLLLPPVRRLLGLALASRIRPMSSGPSPTPGRTTVIDGEWVVVDPENPETKDGSPKDPPRLG